MTPPPTDRADDSSSPTTPTPGAPTTAPRPSRALLRTQDLLSILELLSIATLLLNLATLHLRPLTATLGPLHGALYLAVAVTALFGRHLHIRTRFCALIPLAGGLLTLLNTRTERRPH